MHTPSSGNTPFPTQEEGEKERGLRDKLQRPIRSIKISVVIQMHRHLIKTDSRSDGFLKIVLLLAWKGMQVREPSINLLEWFSTSPCLGALPHAYQKQDSGTSDGPAFCPELYLEIFSKCCSPRLSSRRQDVCPCTSSSEASSICVS